MNYYSTYGNYGYNTMPTSTQPFGYPFNPYMNYGQNYSQSQSNNQQQQQTQAITNTNKIFVSSLDEVKGRNLLPNSDMLFLDNDKPILYQKVVDGKGQATYKMFDITPHDDAQDTKNENLIDLSAYVPRSDFDALKGEIGKLQEQVNKISISKLQSDVNNLKGGNVNGSTNNGATNAGK